MGLRRPLNILRHSRSRTHSFQIEDFRGMAGREPIRSDSRERTALALRATSASEMSYLTHLLYTSRACQRFTPEDLRSLSVQSTERNHSVSVTGMLLYSAGSIVQLLEGRARTLDALMKRIALDSRHTDVRVLLRAGAPRRLFPRWYMGVLDLDTLGSARDRARLSAALLEGLDQHEAGERAMSALREFRRLLPDRQA